MVSGMDAMDAGDFATISLAKLCDPATAEQEIARLLTICETCGFFYLADHGLPYSLMERVIDASRSFFLLPTAVKEDYGQDKHQVVPSYSRGWSTKEHLDGIRDDKKEIIDLGIARPVTGQKYTGPNVLPPDDVAPDFTKSHLELQSNVTKRILPVLLRSLALALGKPETFFDAAFKEPNLIQRAVYYPPGDGRAGKHTDVAFLTVLVQEPSPKSSLKVFTGGRWVEVKATTDLLVVNMGDTLQWWTDGRFVSTPHQVIHTSSSSRISLPLFYYPDIAAEFESIETGKKYTSLGLSDDNLKRTWTGKGSGRCKELM